MIKYENDKVSVVIPAYNSERFIVKTLDSVFSQTYKNIEVIIVDDASTDNTKSIILNYIKDKKNSKYLCSKRNKGVGAARNKAINVATGKYIAFVDADDIWESEKLQVQIDYMKKNHVAFCYTAIDMIDEDANIVREKRKVIKKVNYKTLLRNTVIATSSVVLDREVIGDIKMPQLKSGQDYATWLSILRKGIVAEGIDKVYTHYRVRNNSLSSKKYKSIIQVWSIQVFWEKINPLVATWNTIYFVINAMKKYMMSKT